MSQNIANSIFYCVLWILFSLLLCLYLSVSYNNIPYIPNRQLFLFGMSLSCLIYIFLYRKDNLLCFETIFFPLYILSVFFKDLILDTLIGNSIVSSIYYTPFPPAIESKGLILQSIALIAFMLGASRINNKVTCKSQTRHFIIPYNFTMAVWVLSLFILAFICFLYFNGTISSWFHYSSEIKNYTNEYIVYLTILFLVLTIFEFSNLYNINCHTIVQFIKSVNKVYLFDIAIITILLLISGNRNEALLILLPPVLAYSIFIKKINNNQFIIGLFIGVSLMIFIGVTRHIGVSVQSVQNSDISLFEISRDFGFVDKNTNYLIEYTDKHKPIYFKNAINNLFSSIPFLGGVLVPLLNIGSDTRSTQITTDGMQSIQNIDSGLGTSLIGDLYYTGSFLFVLIYMYLFGWLIAKLYSRFIINKKYNMWLLAIFLFLVSNVIYCIRAEWTMPFRYIGFSLVVILICRIFFIPKSNI